MKNTYQLQDKIFNIKLLREVSELKIVNVYEQQERKKELDNAIEKNLPFKDRFTTIPPVHFYIDYTEDCEEATITIDGKEYRCTNYVSIEKPDKSFWSLSPCKTTLEQIKKYNEFKQQAEELITAFKKY